MSGAVYQQLREQLHYLTLSAAAEQLAIQLEGAQKSRPSYTQFLHDLLAVEVESVFELIAPGAPTTPVQGGPGRFGSWE